MLKVRVIPTLLWKGFGLVKGKSFNSWRRVGSVMPAIKVYNQRDVDELVLMDITATNEGREIDCDEIEQYCRECFVPLTVGGGVQSFSQAQKILNSGADKIAINTALFEHPELITEIANQHGSQCVVVSIDANPIPCNSMKWTCFSHSGLKNTGVDVVSWAKEVEDRGAGEILLTSVNRDGTMLGYDLGLVEKVVKAVKIPVIASGGAGNYQDMVDVILKSGASAVAAASIFHFTELTPAGAKQALADSGVPVRGYKNASY
jgi:imidazole glycerol-phosphate synthase subunit HisF